MLRSRNKQLTAIIKSRGIEYIIPLGPAEEVGLQHLQTHDVYDTAVNVMLESDTLTNDAKGRIVEGYIINNLEKLNGQVIPVELIKSGPMETSPSSSSPSGSFSSVQKKRKSRRSSLSSWPTVILFSKTLRRIFWSEELASAANPPLKSGLGTLLVPRSPSFPDADFFLYCPGPTAASNVLWAFQVSVTQDINAKVTGNSYFQERRYLTPTLEGEKIIPAVATQMAVFTGVPVEQQRLIFILSEQPKRTKSFLKKCGERFEDKYVGVFTFKTIEAWLVSLKLLRSQ
jgi:hypothetical protein